MNTADMLEEFTQKANQVSAVVSVLENLDEAFEKCVSLCLEKKACAKDGQRRIAAPDLAFDQIAGFENLCLKNGIDLVRENLRQFEEGVDLGLTFTDFGIAETGTLVVESNSEDKRLATMISELHVAFLSEKDIRATVFDVERELAGYTRKPGSYTAFITGASRTADIERVLALGVHGPLELHIMILTEEK